MMPHSGHLDRPLLTAPQKHFVVVVLLRLLVPGITITYNNLTLFLVFDLNSLNIYSVFGFIFLFTI